jgi:hypothetical protein
MKKLPFPQKHLKPKDNVLMWNPFQPLLDLEISNNKGEKLPSHVLEKEGPVPSRSLHKEVTSMKGATSQ